MRLKNMIGKSKIAIQRISQRMPSQNEGNRSPNERSLGLKAKKVVSLNKVKISKKIKNRLITQRTVFGIFNRINMMFCSGCYLPKKEYKRMQFHWFQQSFYVNFYILYFCNQPREYFAFHIAISTTIRSLVVSKDKWPMDKFFF